MQVTPSNDKPYPDSFADEVGASLKENARVSAQTASLMAELGMPFEMTEEDEALARELFESFDVPKKGGKAAKEYNPPSLYTGSVAIKLAALLDAYDQRVVTDAVQVRTYITNRLLEISQCGDSKQELRAIELLGKLSDVGAFTEKSEITVTHKTSDDLRKAIETKIQRLIDMEVVDVEAKSVEEELGLTNEDEQLRTSDVIDEDTQAT